MKTLNENAKTATKTIFCDVDGTLVKFPDSIEGFKDLPKGKKKLQLLPGALDKLWEWETRGYRIILTTGRKESMRETTERQLTEAGIFWDQLVMGLGPGPRYLINDINNGSNTAYAVNVERNEGIGDVNLDNVDRMIKPVVVENHYGEDIACPPPEIRGVEQEAKLIADQNHVRTVVDHYHYDGEKDTKACFTGKYLRNHE